MFFINENRFLNFNIFFWVRSYFLVAERLPLQVYMRAHERKPRVVPPEDGALHAALAHDLYAPV